MQPVLILNVVGLTPRLIGPDTPRLARLIAGGSMRPLATVTPAVTCTVQSTLLTGLSPQQHGAVGNGWYFKDLGEILFWRQSARLVAGERVFEAARRLDPDFTCANICWWYAMHAGFDVSVTPRPQYRADGRKIPDCWTAPAALRDELTQKLGPFPLFSFWGPATSIRSSQWIADCARHIRMTRQPTLTLVYLPHLDYDLQRLGPHDPGVGAALREIDAVCGELIDDAARDGADVVVVSEYGIGPVSKPIPINRALRQAGWLQTRAETGGEQLDLAGSQAFAVADHQIAHVHVAQAELLPAVAQLLRGLDGVEEVLVGDERRRFDLDHPRAGDIVALARADAWFSYYYWLDDALAPDWARTVDIHRKPGYDPVELFVDPSLWSPRLAVGWRLAKRAAGLRALMDVIPLDASLVRGSHGRVSEEAADGPLIISSRPDLAQHGPMRAEAFKPWLLGKLFPAATALEAAQ